MKHSKCKSCGGEVEFAPGKEEQVCIYCGATNAIEASEEVVRELDYKTFLAQVEASGEHEERLAVICDGCGAHIQFEKNVVVDECTFCGSSLNANQHSERVIKPRSLLPFSIERKNALEYFKKWICSRWFAPNDLKKCSSNNRKLSGVYSPYWTYDSVATTQYTGKRGEHYYVSVSYTTTENGKTVHKTRQERRTRWYPASGVVRNSFDDLMIRASESLPEKLAHKLEPWDLENLVSYNPDYLSGFQVESYSVELESGFEKACDIMETPIRKSIKLDIGGDEQRIHTTSTAYSNITFKHILLPVWISAYRYKNEVYRFLVNARTGEIQGERPWSWIKITLATLATGGVAIAIGFAIANSQ